MLRLGLGGTLGPVDLWGGLGLQPHLTGPTVGLAFPLAPTLRLRMDTLFGDSDGGHTTYEAAAGFAYDFEVLD